MERRNLPDRRRTNPENKKPNLDKLGFDDLKTVYERAAELAKTTYTRTEDGFRSVVGDFVKVGQTIRDDLYRVTNISRNPTLHAFMAGAPSDSVLIAGSADKEEVMRAAGEMIEVLGNRII